MIASCRDVLQAAEGADDGLPIYVGDPVRPEFEEARQAGFIQFRIVVYRQYGPDLLGAELTSAGRNELNRLRADVPSWEAAGEKQTARKSVFSR